MGNTAAKVLGCVGMSQCIFSTFANGKKEAVYLRNMYNI